MNIFLIANLPYEGIIHAASWTLIHSLWQGLILATMAVFVVQLTRRCAPGIRYNLLLVLFGCQLVASVVTFSILLHQFPDTGTGAYSSLSFLKAHSAGAGDTGPGNGVMTGVTEKLIVSIDSHTRMIVNCWLLALTILFIRMLAGMSYLKRLRRDKLISVGDEWTTRLQELKEKMQMHVPVCLKESSLVKVPLVIGFFKPLILIPLGLLNNLPPEQVEAIVCHELAHIRRNDFIVNIFQSLVEIIFFFNPSVWWISSLLREERENCCDEAAVQGIIEKKTLIRAFVSFHEYQPVSFSYVQRFAGSEKKLFMRIKRIFYNKNKAVAPYIQVIITGCLVIAGVMLFAFKSGHEKVAATAEHKMGRIWVTQNNPFSNRTDTVPGGNDLQNKLKEIDRKYAPMQAESERRTKEIRTQIKALQTESAGKEGVELKKILGKEDSLMAMADEMGGNASLLKNEEVMRLLNPGAPVKHIDTAKRTDDEKLARDQEKKYTMKELGEMDGGRPTGGQDKKYTMKQYAQMDEDNGHPGKERQHIDAEVKKGEAPRSDNGSRSDAFFGEFLNDLLADGLISNKDEASFFLSKEKFIVNDKLQPEKVRQKYLNKFLTAEHVSIVYRFHSDMIGWMDN